VLRDCFATEIAMRDEASPTSTAAPSPPPNAIESLLTRPIDQRIREFKYRFAQAVVFGLPVLALQRFGRALGWVEGDRWVGLMQLALAGWVVYVAAAGMLFEGIVLLARRQLRIDLIIALIALTLYFLSAASIARLVVRGSLWFPPRFDAVVALLIVWCGVRWWWLRARGLAGQLDRHGRRV
jgi:cation transport ATPase